MKIDKGKSYSFAGDKWTFHEGWWICPAMSLSPVAFEYIAGRGLVEEAPELKTVAVTLVWRESRLHPEWQAPGTLTVPDGTRFTGTLTEVQQ